MTNNPFNDHQYLKICSEKTLQTNDKGFFMDFVRMVSENAGEAWIKNVFGKVKSNRERIDILYRYEGVGSTFKYLRKFYFLYMSISQYFFLKL